CGELLILAKESVQAERGAKGQWKPWLEGRFSSRLPVSTAELHIKLAKNKDFLFGKMQLVSDRRMSLRQAVRLIPLTLDGEKRRAAAQERAAKREEAKEAADRKEVADSLSNEERVGHLAVDEMLLVAKSNRGVDVVEIFMALTTTLTKDQ